jgi:murein DD-endopeptidase MepM/ murein hydrolase activator NlpD
VAWVQKDYNVVIKAIGTVESNMTWNALNLNDAITVGIAQWWGPRAANLLHRIRTENPTSATGMASTLVADLTQYGPDAAFWQTRYLSSGEADSLRPILNANRTIQTSQFSADLAEYVTVARNWGMDPDGNKKAVQFFCTMYHQGPARTWDVLDAIGTSPTLYEIYQGALNNPVLGQYKTRQNTCYQIINAGDSSGVPTDTSAPKPEDEEIPHEPDAPQDPGVIADAVRRITLAGDHLMVHFENAPPVMAYHTTGNEWMPKANELGAAYPDYTPPATDPGDPGDPGPIAPGAWANPLDNLRCTQAWGTTRWSDYHSGIDMGAQRVGVPGDPIRAIHDMKILRTGGHGQVLFMNSGYGIIGDLGIHGGDHMYVYYGHLSQIKVNQGDVVKAGDLIATMGGTGANHSNSDFAVHLHIVIFKNRTVNPNGPTTVGRSHTVDVEQYLKSKGVLVGMNACPR